MYVAHADRPVSGKNTAYSENELEFEFPNLLNKRRKNKKRLQSSSRFMYYQKKKKKEQIVT